MAILLKNKAVFLHIPKTGGSWIRHALASLDLIDRDMVHEHADYQHALWNGQFQRDSRVLRRILGRALGWPGAFLPERNTLVFCFVREPLKWYESYWRFMCAEDWRRWGDSFDRLRWHPNMMLNGLGSADFNTFVRHVNRVRPGFVTEMYGWYVRPGVGFVGRQEQLEADLLRLLRIMDIKADAARLAAVGRCNESPPGGPIEWDPEVRRETLKLEYAGYVRYGYAVPDDAEREQGALCDIELG